ncbi:role in replication [Streptococcus criceti]|uniref:Role in replication n=1 Tax=Streptococcus criceti HS-6 TaxID=873449 RepID=G5JTL3_STRCG|nr:hypothetical protein [Streptococcus criceti]EHI74522.1 hypothetical protein STRCR_1110 [Streptococcus criceti HS-6]SUN37684.1 role in replication [Streptococcus criceti]
MKVLYKGKTAQVWKISQTEPYPDWVTSAFAKRQLLWKDNKKLQVMVPSLFPHWARNDHYWGYGIYAIAYIGDIIDLTNERIISPNKFKKDYSVIDGD